MGADRRSRALGDTRCFQHAVAKSVWNKEGGNDGLEAGSVSDGWDEELMVTLGFVAHVSCGGLELHSIRWGEGGVKEQERSAGVHPGHDLLCVLIGNTNMGTEPDLKMVAKIQQVQCCRVTQGPLSTTE